VYDEFDIDVMAQLAFRRDVDPEHVLSTLDYAIRSEPGTRYPTTVDSYLIECHRLEGFTSAR
jgi:hypothetical protein